MSHVEVPVSIGWICVFVGILAFGFFTTPIKLDCVKRSKVDPFMIQLFLAVPVFLFSLPVLAFEKFEFSFYGIWGAALWVPSSILSIIGIHFLGIAVAQSLWGGLSIIFSFLWGIVLFKQETKSLGLTALGIVLLTVGIIGTTLSDIDFVSIIFSFCSKKRTGIKKFLSKERSIPEEEMSNEVEEKIEEIDDENDTKSINSDVDLDIEEKKSSSHDVDNKSKFSLRNLFLGFLSIFTMGIINGALMVPAKLDSGNPLYFFSFGVGVLIFSPLCVTIVYIFKTFLTRSPPWTYEQVRDGAIPGLLVGTMFVFGNYAQTYAAFSPLGLVLGFPLVQCCMVLTALNGMLFFGELNNWRKKLQFFCSCIFLVIPGFFLVAGFGMS